MAALPFDRQQTPFGIRVEPGAAIYLVICDDDFMLITVNKIK
jgi:hypothetical protein